MINNNHIVDKTIRHVNCAVLINNGFSTEYYDKESIIKMKVLEEVNAGVNIGSSVSANELTVSLIRDNFRRNNLREGTRIEAYIIQELKDGREFREVLGVFYINNVKESSKHNKIDITAYDWLYPLLNVETRPSFAMENTNMYHIITNYLLMNDIRNFEIDEALHSHPVKLVDFRKDTFKKNLEEMLMACNCYAFIDRDNKLKIQKRNIDVKKGCRRNLSADDIHSIEKDNASADRIQKVIVNHSYVYISSKIEEILRMEDININDTKRYEGVDFTIPIGRFSHIQTIGDIIVRGHSISSSDISFTLEEFEPIDQPSEKESEGDGDTESGEDEIQNAVICYGYPILRSVQSVSKGEGNQLVISNRYIQNIRTARDYLDEVFNFYTKGNENITIFSRDYTLRLNDIIKVEKNKYTNERHVSIIKQEIEFNNSVKVKLTCSAIN